MVALMDELQLRMTIPKVTAMADAIESHIMAGDAEEQAPLLAEILTWLRYRLARAASATTTDSKS